MTGPAKQPPPSHVLNAGKTAGRLARYWSWRLLFVGLVAFVAIMWNVETGVVEWAKGVWYSRASDPTEGGIAETPPDNEGRERRTYSDMQRDVQVETEKKIEEAVKKTEEKIEKKEREREAAREREKEKKEPTPEERARDGEIGGGIKVAEVLAPPDDDPEMSEGGDDFGGLGSESNGIRRVALNSAKSGRGGRKDADGSDFVAGSDCQVNEGTPIRVRLLSSIDTARAGGWAIGKVAGHVYDTSTGTCLAIPDGSTFSGPVATTTVKNQKAAEITFTSLTRPHPRNDTLTLDMPASDSMGRGGVEGRINSNLVSSMALVAIATAVEILPVLVGGDDEGDLIGTAIRGFLGGSETPLNRAAREQLEKPSTIELDQDKEEDRKKSVITVILRRHVNADDFRGAAPQRKNADKRRAGG